MARIVYLSHEGLILSYMEAYLFDLTLPDTIDANFIDGAIDSYQSQLIAAQLLHVK